MTAVQVTHSAKAEVAAAAPVEDPQKAELKEQKVSSEKNIKDIEREQRRELQELRDRLARLSPDSARSVFLAGAEKLGGLPLAQMTSALDRAYNLEGKRESVHAGAHGEALSTMRDRSGDLDPSLRHIDGLDQKVDRLLKLMGNAKSDEELFGLEIEAHATQRSKRDELIRSKSETELAESATRYEAQRKGQDELAKAAEAMRLKGHEQDRNPSVAHQKLRAFLHRLPDYEVHAAISTAIDPLTPLQVAHLQQAIPNSYERMAA